MNRSSLEHFARLTCTKHKARFSFVCPEIECLESKTQFLCASCMRSHKADHTSRALPYSDVFSQYMNEELEKWQETEFDLKRTVQKFYPELHHQIDQLYKQISEDLIRYLDSSRDNMKKRFSPPVVDENVSSLAENFGSVFLHIFEKKVDQITANDLKTYIETYTDVNNKIVVIGENLTATKEKVLINQKDVQNVMAYVNKEGEKLKKYCDEFVRAIASFTFVDESGRIVGEGDEDHNTEDIPYDHDLFISKVSNITSKFEGPITKSDQLEAAIHYKLKDIHIESWNEGDDAIAEEIASKLKELKTINNLHISFMDKHLTNDGFVSICSTLPNFPDITNMTLVVDGGDSSITNEALKTLGSSLNNLPNLQTLEIRIQRGQNCITDEGIKILATNLENLTKLTHINLFFAQGDNSIKDEGLKALGESFEKLQTLTHIKIYLSGEKNLVGDEGIKAFGRSLAKMPGLISIMLYCNGFKRDITDEGAFALAQSLENLKKLTYFAFNFSGNKVTIKGRESLQNAARKVNVSNSFIMGIRS